MLSSGKKKTRRKKWASHSFQNWGGSNHRSPSFDSVLQSHSAPHHPCLISCSWCPAVSSSTRMITLPSQLTLALLMIKSNDFDLGWDGKFPNHWTVWGQVIRIRRNKPPWALDVLVGRWPQKGVGIHVCSVGEHGYRGHWKVTVSSPTHLCQAWLRVLGLSTDFGILLARGRPLIAVTAEKNAVSWAGIHFLGCWN